MRGWWGYEKEGMGVRGWWVSNIIVRGGGDMISSKRGWGYDI